MAKIQLKRGLSANIGNVTLAVAEPAFTLDTGKLYIGDGTKSILINPDKVKGAEVADKLAVKRQFSATGDATATAVEFDGTQNVALNLTLKPSGVSAGTFAKVTVNTKGIVTGSAALVEADIPNLGAAKIVEAANKKFMTDAERAKVAAVDGLIEEGDTFHTDMLTVNALGGIGVGEDLNNLPIEQVITKLLYPYVAPTVSASSTPNGGTFENGTTQKVTNIRAVVGKKSERITKVEVFDGATSLGVKTTGIEAGGTFDFPVNVSVTANKNFQVKVTDASSKLYTANTGSFSFVYPYFMGPVAENATINEALIESLTKKIEGKGNKSHAFTTNNQRMVFAYPKAHGALKQIFDPNNFDVTGTFGRQEVSITGPNGSAQVYYVYVNSASSVTNFTIRFNY